MPTSLYNTIQYKTYNAPYVTKMLFVGALSVDALVYAGHVASAVSNLNL